MKNMLRLGVLNLIIGLNGYAQELKWEGTDAVIKIPQAFQNLTVDRGALKTYSIDPSITTLEVSILGKGWGKVSAGAELGCKSPVLGSLPSEIETDVEIVRVRRTVLDLSTNKLKYIINEPGVHYRLWIAKGVVFTGTCGNNSDQLISFKAWDGKNGTISLRKYSDETGELIPEEDQIILNSGEVPPLEVQE